MTAAHCFCSFSNATTAAACATDRYVRGTEQLSDTDVQYISAYFHDSGPLAIQKIIINSQYDWPKKDLAIVKLKDGIHNISPVSLNNVGAVEAGTFGWIVGFGLHGPFKNGKMLPGGPVMGSQGLKLWSTIKTTPCSKSDGERELICWIYQQNNDQLLASTCQGDSGGPLFAEMSSEWKLVGVTSGGPMDCLPVKNKADLSSETFDVEVFKNLSWITSTAGIPLQDGHSNSILIAPGSRAIDNPYRQFIELPDQWISRPFTLPAGLTSLRISINSTPTFSKLRLELASPGPSAGCSSSTDDDSYVSCVVLNPGGGLWNVSVAGAKPQEFQVVGTVSR